MDSPLGSIGVDSVYLATSKTNGAGSHTSGPSEYRDFQGGTGRSGRILRARISIEDVEIVGTSRFVVNGVPLF